MHIFTLRPWPIVVIDVVVVGDVVIIVDVVDAAATKQSALPASCVQTAAAALRMI